MVPGGPSADLLDPLEQLGAVVDNAIEVEDAGGAPDGPQRMTLFRRFAAGGWVTRRMGEDALKATFKTVTNSQRADRDALFDACMSLAAH
jgi:hypothetical protein